MAAPLDLNAIAEAAVGRAVEQAVAGALDLAALKLLKVGEAADLLSVGETTVRHLLADGDLEAVRVLSELRVTAASIRAYLERQRSPSSASRPIGRTGRRIERLA